jgi:ADP-ribose pyrophosphatase YjhB (NUDIX family)
MANVIRVNAPDKSYDFKIAGDKPTEEEYQRMDAFLMDRYPDYQGRPPEPDLLDYPGEFFTAIGRGALDMGATTLRGMGAEELSDDLREFTAKNLARDPSFEDSTAITLGEGLGSTIPFLATATAPGRLAKVGLGFGLGGFAGSGEQAERIEAYEERTGEDVPKWKEYLSRSLGFGVGLTEMLPPFRILKGIPRNIPNSAKEFVGQSIMDVIKGGGEEGLQEAASGLLQDFIEAGIYNPDLNVGESMWEEFTLGAGVGGILTGAVNTYALPGRIRKARQQERDLRAGEQKEQEKVQVLTEAQIDAANAPNVLQPDMQMQPNESPGDFARRQMEAEYGPAPKNVPNVQYNPLQRQDGFWEILNDNGVAMGAPARTEAEAKERIDVYSQFAYQARVAEELANVTGGADSTTGQPTTATAGDIHQMLDEKNIKWDEDPDFMAFTKTITGKERLDDLTSYELGNLKNTLAPLPTQPSLRSFGDVQNDFRQNSEGTDGDAAKYSLPDIDPATVQPGQTVTLFDPMGTPVDVQAEAVSEAGSIIYTHPETGESNIADASEFGTKDPTSPLFVIESMPKKPEVREIPDNTLAWLDRRLSEKIDAHLNADRDAVSSEIFHFMRQQNAVRAEKSRRETSADSIEARSMNEQARSTERVPPTVEDTENAVERSADTNSEQMDQRHPEKKDEPSGPAVPEEAQREVEGIPAPDEKDAVPPEQRKRQKMKKGKPAKNAGKQTPEPVEVPEPEVRPEQEVATPMVRFNEDFEADTVKLEKEFQEKLNKLGASSVMVRLAKTLFTNKSGTRGAHGVFANKLIGLSLGHTDPNASYDKKMEALTPHFYHEYTHWLRTNDKFKPSEWRGLVAYSKRNKMPGQNLSIYEAARKVYTDGGTDLRRDSKARDRVEEEAVAKIFELATAGTIKLNGGPKAQHKEVMGFIEKLGDTLRGRNRNSVQSIFERFNAGQIAARPDKIRTFQALRRHGYPPISKPPSDAADEERRREEGRDVKTVRESNLTDKAKYSFDYMFEPDEAQPTMAFSGSDEDLNVDELPRELNGWSLEKIAPGDKEWAAYEDTPIMNEPPLPDLDGKTLSTGMVMIEPDGRVWITEPTNHFGGYEHTFPKGGMAEGLTLQQNARKEVYEETGLLARAASWLGDYEGDKSVTRYYIGMRHSGSPLDHGLETQSVKLVDFKELDSFLNKKRDKNISGDIFSLMNYGDSTLNATYNNFYGKDVNTFQPFDETMDAGDLEDLFNSALGAVTKDSEPQNTEPSVINAHHNVLADGDPLTGAPTNIFEYEMFNPTQRGSNLGATFTDSQGNRFYIKAYENPEQARQEVVASRLYQAAGIPAPRAFLVSTLDPNTADPFVFPGGMAPSETAVATRWVEGYSQNSTVLQNQTASLTDVHDGFVVDAWLGNWDVVGLDFDNMLVGEEAGAVIRIDQGGTLQFRAQGGSKPFTDEVLELDTMRDPQMAPQATRVFEGVTDEDLRTGAQRIMAIPDDVIYDIVNQAGADPSLVDTLIARKAYIADKVGVIKNSGVIVPDLGANVISFGDLKEIGMDWKASHREAFDAWEGNIQGPGNARAMDAWIKNNSETWQASLDFIHSRLRKLAPSGKIFLFRDPGGWGSYSGPDRAGMNWRFSEEHPYMSMSINHKFGSSGITGRFAATVDIEDTIGVTAGAWADEAEITVKRSGIEQTPFVTILNGDYGSAIVNPQSAKAALAGAAKTAQEIPGIAYPVYEGGAKYDQPSLVHQEETYQSHSDYGRNFQHYTGSMLTANFGGAVMQRAINDVVADGIAGARAENMPFFMAMERIADKDIDAFYKEHGRLPDFVRPGVDISLRPARIQGKKGMNEQASQGEMNRTLSRLLAGAGREVEVALFNQNDGSSLKTNAARIMWTPETQMEVKNLANAKSLEEFSEEVQKRQYEMHRKMSGLVRSIVSSKVTVQIPANITGKQISEFWRIAEEVGSAKEDVKQADEAFPVATKNNPFTYLEQQVGDKPYIEIVFEGVGRNEDVASKSAQLWYYDAITAGKGEMDATERYLRGQFFPEEFEVTVGEDGSVEAPFANEPHAAWRRPVAHAILRRLAVDDGTWGRNLSDADRAGVQKNLNKIFTEEAMPFEHQKDSKLRNVAEYNAQFASQSDRLADLRKWSKVEDLKTLREELEIDPDTKRFYSQPYDDNLTEEMNAVMNKHSPHRKQATVGQSILDSLQQRGDWLTALRQKFIDKYDKIAKNSQLIAQMMGDEKMLYADSSAAAAAYLSDRARGIFASVIKAGVPTYINGGFKVVTEIGGQKVGGLLDILQPLYQNGYNTNLVRQWQTYGIARREQQILIDQAADPDYKPDYVFQMSNAERTAALNIANAYPEVQVVFEAYNEWNGHTVKFMRDTGVIDDAAADEWMRGSSYIPFYRELDGEGPQGPVGVLSGLADIPTPRKLKGSTERRVGDPIENLARNAQAAITAGMKNVAMQRAMRDAYTLGQARNLTAAVEAGEISREQMEKDSTHTYRQDGKTINVAIYDPLLFDAVSSVHEGRLPGWASILAAPSTLLRETVTRDPGFMLANMLRDTASVWVTSGANITPVVSTLNNFVRESKDFLAGKQDENPLALGGVIGGYDFSQDPKNIKKWMERTMREKGMSKKTNWDYFRLVWDKAGDLTTASDAATRMAVYNDVLKDTGNEYQAMYQALEVINFSRRGSSPVMRVMTAMIPFLNARIQGLDVLARAMAGTYSAKDVNNRSAATMRFLLRGATLTGLSLAYYALMYDDDDYLSKGMAERDDHWIVPVGEGLPPVMIPIPFEVGFMFKVIPERLAAMFAGEDLPRDVSASILRGIGTTLEMNPVPQFAMPVLEATMNYSFFKQKDIVPYYMENLDPTLEARTTTSDTARRLAMGVDAVARGLGLASPGEEAGMLESFRSPLKMEQIIKGYTGTIGTYILETTDALVRMVEGAPERPGRRLDQQPILKRFLSANTGSGQLEQFYEMRSAVREVAGSIRELEARGRFDDMAEYYQTYGWLLQMDNALSNIDDTLGKYRDLIELIFRDPNMSAEEKEGYLEDIISARSEVVSVVPELRKFLYKDMKEEWKKSMNP